METRTSKAEGVNSDSQNVTVKKERKRNHRGIFDSTFWSGVSIHGNRIPQITHEEEKHTFDFMHRVWSEWAQVLFTWRQQYKEYFWSLRIREGCMGIDISGNGMMHGWKGSER